MKSWAVSTPGDQLSGGVHPQLEGQVELTVLWIEHVMGAIMQAAERVIVLDQGQVLMAASPNEVVHDPRVIQAYLGE
jgi:branched-chain amino acid transport system ATP-binding protein